MATAHCRWFGFNVAYTAPYNRGDLPAGYIVSSAEDMSHYLIAQLNGGQYGNASVLSLAGINLMQTEPICGTYSMGWFSDEVNGISVIGHAGGTSGFQSHLSMVCSRTAFGSSGVSQCARLDAFPNTELTTTTDLASGVMSLMVNQHLYNQGMSIIQKYWILDGLVLLFNVWLIFALAWVSKTAFSVTSLRSIFSGSQKSFLENICASILVRYLLLV